MEERDFDGWLKAYGQAWESKQWSMVAHLYATDVRYHWTPFQEPQRGRQEIMDASRQATSRQQDIGFGYEILSVQDDRGIARWWCSFTRVSTGRRVNLDGILVALFNSSGLCREFREWWHSDEPLDERPPLPTTEESRPDA